jgi:hypothetical protein
MLMGLLGWAGEQHCGAEVSGCVRLQRSTGAWAEPCTPHPLLSTVRRRAGFDFFTRSGKKCHRTLQTGSWCLLWDFEGRV